MKPKLPPHCIWLRAQRGDRSYTEIAKGTERYLKKPLSRQYINNIEKNALHPVSEKPYSASKEAVDALAHSLGAPLFEARYQFFMADLPTAASLNGARAAHYIEMLPPDKQAEEIDRLDMLVKKYGKVGAKGKGKTPDLKKGGQKNGTR